MRLRAGHPPGFAPILSLSAISSYICQTLLNTLNVVEQVRAAALPCSGGQALLLTQRLLLGDVKWLPACLERPSHLTPSTISAAGGQKILRCESVRIEAALAVCLGWPPAAWATGRHTRMNPVALHTPINMHPLLHQFPRQFKRIGPAVSLSPTLSPAQATVDMVLRRSNIESAIAQFDNSIQVARTQVASINDQIQDAEVRQRPVRGTCLNRFCLHPGCCS